MNINEKQLKIGMTTLVNDCNRENPDFKTIIAKAVNLGMIYQECKIKEGIDIIFNELHK